MGNELTKFEILALDSRIDAISELLDMDLDDDIHDNLVAELDSIEYKLERELKMYRIRSSGLRLVGQGMKSIFPTP